MLNVSLESRNQSNEGLNSRRRLGHIPGHLSVDTQKDEAVFNDPQGAMVKLDERVLRKMIVHKNDAMKIKLDGQSIGHAILLDWQEDPVTHHPIHFNLKFMNKEQLKGEDMTRKVPLHFGERPSDLSKDWIVQPVLTEITLVGPMTKLPNHLEVSLDNLRPDQPIHAGDIKLPRGVRVLEEETDLGIVTLKKRSTAEVEVQNHQEEMFPEES